MALPLALAHPALLWTGLGLVSVPILIHLFFRRRHRVVRWAAMDFLLAALRKQRRRMQFENMLLLLLRCILIALLALAVARPAVKAAALAPFGGGAKAVVLVVDTSASMGAQHTGRRSLDRAKERAGRLLAELPAGSSVSLLVTRDDLIGGGPRTLLDNATPEEVRVRIGPLSASHGPNQLGEVFRLAGTRLAALSGRKTVVFVTDLQRRDWREPSGERREDVYRSLRALRPEDGPAPPVTILDVGVPRTANVAITDFTIDEGREAFAGTLLGLSVGLVNYGSTPADGTLTLYMARADEGTWEKRATMGLRVPPTLGVGLPAREVRRIHEFLPQGAEGPARFKVVFSAGGGVADRLPADSTRYLSLRVKPPVRFLPVRTVPGALDIVRDVEVLEVIDIAESIFPESLGTHGLVDTDVILWADAEFHGLDERGAAALESFVRRGGGLLAYLGEYALPERVNRLFFKEDGTGLFPMRLAPGPMRLDEQHPVLIDLEASEQHALFREARVFGSPEFVGYRRVEDCPERSVIARFATGDPAVIESRVGRGRVLIVTSTPDERAFRLNGSLLPAIFFFNAAHYLVAENPADRNVVVGMPLRVPLFTGARQVTVEPPEEAGGRTEEPVGESPGPFLYTGTSHPGFYRFTVEGVTAAGASSLPLREVHLAAANLDAGEGDLRRLTPGELQRTYQGANLTFTDDVEDALPRVTGSGELSRALLGAVVFLLILELFLAWRFGVRRRPDA